MQTLGLRHISKNYGAVKALHDVSIQLEKNDVVALVGDNGAGKSTLAKIISGALGPNGGGIEIDGKELHFSSPADASQHGIEMVYQDLSLVEPLDIAENLFLGREARRRGVLGKLGMIDKARMRTQSTEFLGGLGIRLSSVRRQVELLSGGQRQAVALARATFRAREGAGVVILDEPTAALGVAQTRQVVELIRRLHDHGVLVILITHNMPLCFELASRILVLRRGSLVADLRPDATNLEEVVAYITGAEMRSGRQA